MYFILSLFQIIFLEKIVNLIFMYLYKTTSAYFDCFNLNLLQGCCFILNFPQALEWAISVPLFPLLPLYPGGTLTVFTV